MHHDTQHVNVWGMLKTKKMSWNSKLSKEMCFLKRQSYKSCYLISKQWILIAWTISVSEDMTMHLIGCFAYLYLLETNILQLWH